LRPTTRSLNFETLATLGAALTRRSKGASQDLFEFVLECFELGDLVPHCGQLLANQREEVRTNGRARPAIQRGRQPPQTAKRQPQRACPTDEAYPLHARLIVLSIA
jgi:hypothetical protein